MAKKIVKEEKTTVIESPIKENDNNDIVSTDVNENTIENITGDVKSKKEETITNDNIVENISSETVVVNKCDNKANYNDSSRYSFGYTWNGQIIYK